jgi:hypothetical protein
VTQSPASKTNAFSVVMIDRLPKGKARETWRHKVMDLKSQRIFFRDHDRQTAEEQIFLQG